MKDRKVCVINTGGTIGMVDTENGYAPKQGYFKGVLEGIDDLNAYGMPEWDYVEFDPLLDSSNVSVNEWNLIGQAIADRYDDYDGFVVVHGTDTMAYTAAALSFMLEGLDKPVVLTGSQIPLCKVRSDGRDNIITSLMIAAEGMCRRVMLYFGGKLLAGTRAVKTSSDRFIAFDSPCFPQLADAGTTIEYHRSLIRRYCSTDVERKKELNVVKFRHAAVGALKMIPGMSFGMFEPMMVKHLDGVVLETFGSGNIPAYAKPLNSMIRQAYDNGTVICVCSQCQHGTVRLGAYETSSALARAGAVSGYDMTTEAAIAKLYYLFSKDLPTDDIRHMMEMNLRGEISK